MITVPAVPQNLLATSDNNQLTLTWSPSPGATAYTLYWSTTAGVTKTNGTALANVISPFAHQQLSNGTSSFYVVTASNSAGESAESVEATGIPAAINTALPTVVVTRPDRGERSVRPNVTIVARLSKTLNPATVTTTTVTLAGPSGNVPAIVSTTGNTLSIAPTGSLAPESVYTATIGTGVHDLGGVGLAVPFSWQFTTASPAPGNLTAVAGNYAATLTWSPVAGATQYALRRSLTAGGPPDISFPVMGTTYTDTNAPWGTTFRYRVEARTPFGLTPPSSEVVVVTSNARPLAPTGLRVLPRKRTALVSWNAVATATGYTLYRASSSAGLFLPIVSGHQTTSYLDTGLPAGSSVVYAVQVESLVAGSSAYSKEAAGKLDETLVSAPANLAVTARRFGALELSWDAVASATGYVVYRLDSPTAALTPAAFVTDGTTFQASGLTNGIPYRHFVAAVVNGLIGDFAEVTATPGPLFPPEPVVLQAPRAEVNRIELGWTGGAGATLATVYRSLTSGSGYSPIGTSPTDTNVTAGTRYYYVVRADNGAALGSYSNEVSAIPLASGTPAAPINVAAEPVNGEVQVSWAPVAGANGYVVSAALSIGGAPYATCSTAEPFETRCSVGLPNETTFHFSVRASNGVTLSADSAEVIATPTGQGTTAGLPATSVSVVGGNGALTVRWSPVVGATLYRVFRRSRLTDWAQLGAATPATAVNDVSTVNGTEYVYAVQATNTSGLRVSPWARTVYVTATARRPVRPQNFAVVPYDHGLMARWSPIAGATGYVVQAGFYPGWSASTPQVSCSTDDPYETRCSLAADNGTPYFVSMYATTPEGSSAFTDELSRTPDPTAPAPPMPTVLAGNGSISLRAPPISGATSYRFFRRTFGTDWTQVGNPTIPLFQQVLSNAIGYRYAVQTVNASGVGSEWQFTGWTSAQADRPPVPTGVTLTPGNGVVQLRWEPVDGVVAYYFYNATGPGQPLGLRDSTADALDTQWSWAQSNGVATTLTLLGLMPSVYGDTSAEVTATPSTASPLSPTLTFVPGNEAMQLLWAPVSGATGYRVYRRSPASEWQLHVTLTVPGLIDADVQNGESFQYAVQSVGAGGVSAWARTAVALVNAALPHAPTDVALQPGNAALQVEWAAVTGATGYYLYTAPTQSGPWTYVGSPGGSETRFAAPATNGTPTWVAVTATSATGTGVSSVPTSATASASRPTAVSLAAAALVTPGSVALTWSVAADAVSYRVYRRPANGALSFVTSTSSLNYDDVGLASGTTYVWYVETENAAGRGAWSNAASVAAP